MRCYLSDTLVFGTLCFSGPCVRATPRVGACPVGVGVHPVSNQPDVLGPYARSLLFEIVRVWSRNRSKPVAMW